MTPLEIEIILHYYARANDYRDGDISAPSVRETIDRFLEDEDILGSYPPCPESPRKYHLTERGRIFVEALCALPLPEKHRVMPGDAA